MVLALLVAFLSWQPAKAQNVDTSSFEWWISFYADFPIVHPRIRGYLENNPRLRDDPANINQNLLRTALGYKLRDNIEFFQGYAWIQGWIPRYIEEQRVYQQLGVGHVLFDKIQVLHRFRSEERFIQRRDGCAVRLRYMLRLARPIAETRFYLVGYDELFVNVNSLRGGPAAGIDQNRLFAGLGRQINDHLRTEIGYQWQWINRTEPIDDFHANVLLMQTFIHF